jgi:predicted permease
MRDQITVLVTLLLRFVLMIASGFILARFKILDRKDFDGLAKLVVKLLLPMFLLAAIPDAGTRADLLSALPVVAIAFIAILILFGVGLVTAKLLRLPDQMARMHAFCTATTNIGFLGIPLFEGAFGKPGVLVASLFVFANDVMIWTVGQAILTGGKGRLAWRKIFTPSLIALIAGGIMLALNFNPVGNPAWDTVGLIGNMARVLPMVYIGGVLGMMNLKAMRRVIPAVAIVFTKMIGMALLTFYAVRWLVPGLPAIYRLTLALAVGLPTLSSSTVIAGAYGADENYAAGCVMITSLASLATIPLVYWLIA